MKVLVVYYSTYGNVYKMANLVAEGVGKVEGAEAVVRTVPELIPAETIQARPDMKAGRENAKARALGDAGRLSPGRGHRLRHADPVRQRFRPTEEPDRSAHLALAEGGTGGEAGRRFHFDRQLARRTGDDDPDDDGSVGSPRFRRGGRTLFGAGAFYNARRRFGLRSRARGRRGLAPQSTRRRPPSAAPSAGDWRRSD